MLASWAEQTALQVFKNINVAMARNEFDDSNFFLTFMKKPLKKTIKFLEVAELEEAKFNADLQERNKKTNQGQFNQDLKAYVYDEGNKFSLISSGNNSITISTDQSEITMDFFRAKSVLFYLIQRSNQNNLRKYVNLIAFICGIVRGYLPTVIYLEGWSFFPGMHFTEKIMMFIMNFTLFTFYMYVTRFILQSVLDFKRKIFLMESLEGMVSPERTSSAKFVPTLNLLDVTSAYTWLKMRRVVKDYGKRMTVRHELLIPAIFIYMVFIYMFNWVKNLELVSFDHAFIKNLSPFLNIDYVMFSVLILYLLLTIARVNRYYKYHILAIQKVCALIHELSVFQEHYFGIDNGSTFSMIRMQKEMIFDQQPTDPVTRAYITRLKEFCPED
jgi:hypothetical protein